MCKRGEEERDRETEGERTKIDFVSRVDAHTPYVCMCVNRKDKWTQSPLYPIIILRARRNIYRISKTACTYFIQNILFCLNGEAGEFIPYSGRGDFSDQISSPMVGPFDLFQCTESSCSSIRLIAASLLLFFIVVMNTILKFSFIVEFNTALHRLCIIGCSIFIKWYWVGPLALRVYAISRFYFLIVHTAHTHTSAQTS